MIPARIVAFGSSSVYGRGDPEAGGFVGRLRAWHEPRRETNLVYNLGVGGNTTTGMLSRLQLEVSFRKPDLILLYPGLNDTRRTGGPASPTTTPVEQFARNISELLQNALQLAPTIFVSSFPIDEARTRPYRNDWYYLRDDAAEFTDLARKMCEQLNVPYLDIFERWSESSISREIFFDGLHCNAEGHRRLFEEIRELLTRLYG